MAPTSPIALRPKRSEISDASSSRRYEETDLRSSERFQEIQFRDIIRLLGKHIGLILLCLCAGLLIAAVVSMMTPPLYSSTATIEVNKNPEASINFSDQESSNDSGVSGLDLSADLLTERAVLENDSTALTVIKKLNLRSKPPFYFNPDSSHTGHSFISKAWAAIHRLFQHPKDIAAAKARQNKRNAKLTAEASLPLSQAPLIRARDLAIFRKHLRVSLVKGTRLIQIRYTDPNPRQAAAVANAVVQAYLSNYRQTRYNAMVSASTWLAGQLDNLKNRVRESQEKVVAFEQQHGLVGLSAPSSNSSGFSNGEGDTVAQSRLVDLNRDLTEAQVDRISKEAIYRITQQGAPSTVLGLKDSQLAMSSGANSVVAPTSNDMAMLQKLRQERAALGVQYASSATTYGPKNPVMLKLKNQMAAINTQIADEIARIRRIAKSQYDVAKMTESRVQASVSAQEAKVGKLNTGTAQLDVLEQQASSNRRLYEDLYGKLEEAKVAAGVRASDSNTNIVDPGRVSNLPTSPNVPLNLAMGLALGLFCGCGASLLIEYFNDSVENGDEVELLTGAPLLGVVPAFNGNRLPGGRSKDGAIAKREARFRDGAGWLQRAPTSAISESYRTLRTSLLMSKAEGPPKTILVTSASGGDGKSTTCMNTAIALANQGSRVILIDADMRRPSIDRLTDINQSAGLSNLLTSHLDPSSFIQRHRAVANLWLLPAGDPTPVPADLLASKRFRDVLNQLSERYDFVLIDSPPLLLVTDALLIATRVDSVILVVRSGSTSRSALRETSRMLRNVRVRPLGNVLNGAGKASSNYPYKGLIIDYDKSERSERYAS